MNELIARWKTESPQFFKNVALFGKFLVGAGGVIMAACLVAPEIIAPMVVDILKVASSYMVFGGGIVAAVAGLTVEDRQELKDKMNEKDTN